MFAAVVGQSWADDAHPFNLEINGVDWIGRVHYPSINIEMPGPGSNGSMTFTLADPDASITVNEWDEVRFIEHAATRPIQFGGFVQSVRYVAWAANGRSLVVTCVGYGILLDRKVVPSVPLQDGLTYSDAYDVSYRLVNIVNRHGGRVTATAPLVSADPADERYALPSLTGLWTVGDEADATLPIADNQTLRSVIEAITEPSNLYAAADGQWYPAASGHWVDSAAMLRCYPDGQTDSSYYGAETYWKAQFDDASVPGLSIDESGTLAVTSLQYEREDTDRVTSAYIVGGNAAGTGYARARQGLERAGDLEILFSDSESTTATYRNSKGAGAVNRTTAATARGTVSIESSTPVAAWPGRNIQIDVSRLGLTASMNWRITSCLIAFQSSTHRTYTIGFGGNIPKPSMSRRTGRFAKRGPNLV